MAAMRIGIATQTPLLRLAAAAALPIGPESGGAGRPPEEAQAVVDAGPGRKAVLLRPDGDDAGGSQRVRLADHHITPGGVSRMVLQSLQAWRRSGWSRHAHWFSLQPQGPERMEIPEEAIHLHHLRLPPDGMQAYARTKEKLWADLHSLPAPRFDTDDFRFYTRYNASTADAMLAVPDLDVMYVHDFQLLQVGALVGLAAPCVLRWHVPFDAARIAPPTRHFLLRMMEAFDGVVVSTRRDLQGLTNAGFHGKVCQIYPHSDGLDPHKATADARERLAVRLAIPEDAPVLLCVARMDPMKRQDLLVAAFASLRNAHPEARLVLVGNGSFSGSKRVGLGVGKAQAWRDRLESETARLGVADRVVFTGWMPDDLVAAAYDRCDAVVLPSDLEGFGLTVFEAWAHGKPSIVSTGCGAAELVQQGVTGLRFAPGDAAGLTAALGRVLSDRAEAQRMGEAGRIALAEHQPDAAAQREAAFIEESVAAFGAA